MQVLHGLESKIADMAKGLPHLPKEFTKWLSENAWWLTLIGVVIGLLAIFPLLGLTLFASALTATYSVYYPYGLGQSGLFQTSLWVSLGFYVLLVVIEAFAISPLKGMKKRGWDLLFLAVLVSAASSVVNAILTTSFVGLFGAAIALAIGLYVLFEIRSRFVKG